METIIFYTTHCPKCKVIEMKLKQKNIDYIENDDVNAMKEKGLRSAPAIEIGGMLISDFAEAVRYINSL